MLGSTTLDTHVLRNTGGQWMLVGDAPFFRLPLRSGPLAQWSVTLPSEPALAGLTLYSQAAHLFGVTPLALTNSQDLFLYP